MPDILEKLNEESAGTKEWLDSMLRRWKLFVLIFAAIFLISACFIFYYFHKDTGFRSQYTSEGTILVGADIYAIKDPSSTVIKEERWGLRSSEIALLESNIITQQAVGILKAKGHKDTERRIAFIIRNNLKVFESKKYRLGGKGAGETITISITLDDPQKASDIVAAVIESYKRQKESEEEKFFETTQNAFSQQLETARNEMQKAEIALKDFIIENEDIIKTANIFVFAEGKEINEQYLTVKIEILQVEAFVNKIGELSKTDKIGALTSIGRRVPDFINMELKNQFLEKQEEIRRFLLEKGKNSREAVEAEAEMQSIINKIDGEIASGIAAVKLNLNILKDQEAGLAKIMQDPKLYEKITQYNILAKDINVKKRIYNSLAEDVERLDVSEKLKYHKEVKILEEPYAPKRPSATPFSILAKIVMISVFISFILTLALINAIIMLDASVKDAEHLKKITGLLVLAIIPTYRKQKAQGRPR